ncbi:hypothetical protein F2Q68_00020401 [Brassica cretica]|uniref:Uncharacterized protein n=1 Tax=Brassica cretica TaxID=69181 RepID=A0A8S9G065_BRACR|nr:hypothetical protein F2Q68_00020401 [Brassica cretica]
MVQDGGHELKEKEVGDDPDSQIQLKPWPVSQNAKGINLVPCSWISPILGLKLAVGIQMSNLKSQSSRHVSSLSLQENDKIKPIANILWRSPQPAPKRVERML